MNDTAHFEYLQQAIALYCLEKADSVDGREIRKHIGERIRRAREQRGLTQGELAARLGKNAGTVSNYENGNRAISVTELPELARVLDVSIAYFFETEAGLPEALLVALQQQRPLDNDLIQELIDLLTDYLQQVAAMRSDLSQVFEELDHLKGQLAESPADSVRQTPAPRRLLTFTVEETSLQTLLETLVTQKYIRLGENDLASNNPDADVSPA